MSPKSIISIITNGSLPPHLPNSSFPVSQLLFKKLKSHTCPSRTEKKCPLSRTLNRKKNLKIKFAAKKKYYCAPPCTLSVVLSSEHRGQLQVRHNASRQREKRKRERRENKSRFGATANKTQKKSCIWNATSRRLSPSFIRRAEMAMNIFLYLFRVSAKREKDFYFFNGGKILPFETELISAEKNPEKKSFFFFFRQQQTLVCAWRIRSGRTVGSTVEPAYVEIGPPPIENPRLNRTVLRVRGWARADNRVRRYRDRGGRGGGQFES